MIGNLSPVAVDTKSASREFWSRYHVYRRLRHAEVRPNDPVKPDELVEIEMKHEDPFEIQHRYEIARDGQILSDFFVATAKPGSPGYESNKQFMWAAASVHPDHRRRAIGRSWIPLILELMDRHGCTTLTVDTHEESGHQFLKWMGADGKSAGAENRLQLARVDWALLRRWVEDGARQSPATKLEVYDGHLPEEMWKDYCPQFAPCSTRCRGISWITGTSSSRRLTLRTGMPDWMNSEGPTTRCLRASRTAPSPGLPT